MSLALDIAWEPLSPEELARELSGAANGARGQGARSICGRYLIALLASTHPLHDDRWELYGSGARGGWAIKTSWPTRAAARAEAARQAALGGGS